MCVPCSNMPDGRPVCDKCFAAFIQTTDMPREMYKRYGTFVCNGIVSRCPSCVKPVILPSGQVPNCSQCWQPCHFDVDPEQFIQRSTAVMMGVHTRMGCDSLLLDLSIDLLRKICCIADTHDLGDKGVWGMCCVKMLGDVCYEGVVSQIDTGQFFCHYCIKKDFIRFSSDTSDSASENDPLLQVASRM